MAIQIPQQCECRHPFLDSLLSDLQPIDLSAAVHCPRGLSPADETELLTIIRQKQGKERQASLLTLFSGYTQVIALILQCCRLWCRVNRRAFYEERLIMAAQIGFYRAVDEHRPSSCADFSTCAIESMKRSMMYTLLGEASS